MDNFWINSYDDLVGSYGTEISYGHDKEDIQTTINNSISNMQVSCSGPTINTFSNSTDVSPNGGMYLDPGQITAIPQQQYNNSTSMTHTGIFNMITVPIGELSLTMPCNYAQTELITCNDLTSFRLDHIVFQEVNEFAEKYEVRWWRYDKINAGSSDHYITGLIGKKHTITIQVRQNTVSLIFFKGIVVKLFDLHLTDPPRTPEVKFWWFEYLPMIKDSLPDYINKRVKQDRLMIERNIFELKT